MLLKKQKSWDVKAIMLELSKTRKPQAYVTKICNQVQAVADACALGDYQFRCQDYSVTIAEAGAEDLLYCDPPYIARHTDYFNGWNEMHERKLAALLATTPARFILSTWYGNKFRKNLFIDSLWAKYNIITKQHFYHVGAKEINRNSMLEALVTNFIAAYDEQESPKTVQLALLY
jgi:DNA adenine methylase